MRNLQVPSIGINNSIKVIESKQEYSDMLSKNKSFCVYIVNMQKINKEIIDNRIKILDYSHDILILIDEVHTHQKENDKAVHVADYNMAHIS